MNSKFGSKVILAVVASATDMWDPEKAIIDALHSVATPTASFVREAGVPMMHDSIDDRKYRYPTNLFRLSWAAAPV